MLIAVNQQNPQARLIKRVVEIIRDGGIVIYPTDTAYGIGCDLLNKKSIDRVYQVARRPRKQSLSFICPDLKDVSVYANVSDFAYRLLKRHLPGPYTFILKATRLVPKTILPKRQTVGIRIPDNNICLALMGEFGHPLISATVKDEAGAPLSDPVVIQKRFGSVVDAIIDGGVSTPEESTVVSLVDDELLLLRQGKGVLYASYNEK